MKQTKATVLLLFSLLVGCNSTTNNSNNTEDVEYNSPLNISEKTITYFINTSTIKINYNKYDYQDVAQNLINYKYEKTGDKTASIISYMNAVYPVQHDLEYLLTFTSQNGGTFFYSEGNKPGTFVIR
jgi:hypothetical protein